MTNVAEELSLSDSELTREHVVRRVEDWKRRIEVLYGRIQQWIPAGIDVDRSDFVSMHEELMQRFAIPPARLPIMMFSRGGAWLGKIVPQGLWIIGANGRIDVISPSGRSILVDRSENFSDSHWLIAPSDHRRQTAALDESTFRKALGI